MNEDEKFFKMATKLIKDYPIKFILTTTTILGSTFGLGWGINDAIYDEKTNVIEKLEKENAELVAEVENMKLLNQEVQELYSENIIFQSEYLEEDETVSILKGGVIIRVGYVFSDSVNYELSFEETSTSYTGFNYNTGSVTRRVPFEYKGKSYFIVTEKIEDDRVKFTVYFKN